MQEIATQHYILGYGFCRFHHRVFLAWAQAIFLDLMVAISLAESCSAISRS
jgi:hypothetical protein